MEHPALFEAAPRRLPAGTHAASSVREDARASFVDTSRFCYDLRGFCAWGSSADLRKGTTGDRASRGLGRMGLPNNEESMSYRPLERRQCRGVTGGHRMAAILLAK